MGAGRILGPSPSMPGPMLTSASGLAWDLAQFQNGGTEPQEVPSACTTPCLLPGLWPTCASCRFMGQGRLQHKVA